MCRGPAPHRLVIVAVEGEQQVTAGSSAGNLRPMVVPGDPRTRAVLWFRGTMTASQRYDCEVVGFTEPR